MVEELGLDALGPLPAVVDERLPKAGEGADLEDVVGRDPGLGQSPLDQELGHVLAVGVVRLRPTLGAATDGDLGGITEVGRAPGRLELLHHEPPAGGSLQGKVGVEVRELSQPLPERLPGCRDNPSPMDLAGLDILPPVRDLPAMQVQGTYDSHGDLLQLLHA